MVRLPVHGLPLVSMPSFRQDVAGFVRPLCWVLSIIMFRVVNVDGDSAGYAAYLGIALALDASLFLDQDLDSGLSFAASLQFYPYSDMACRRALSPRLSL